jgi:tungstate transport system substrate-binding protein
VRLVIGLVLAVLATVTISCKEPAARLRLATTTSVDNSGLLQDLLPPFRHDTGIELQVLAVGSGRALQLLRARDVDVALTHDPLGEAAFLKEAPSAAYRKIMFNEFVVVGPAEDDALVRHATNAADAMRRIASVGVPFVSRGDESGTHARERQLWQKAGATPRADHLLETGQGMAGTLRVASERRAYTLTDRATFAQLAPTLSLQPLFEHDPDLLNTYAVIAAGDGPRNSDAMRFMTWLSDDAGRDRIDSFTIAGTPPFFVWPPGRPRETPEALPQ